MDIATIFGLIGGIAIVLYAVLSGGDAGGFINIPSAMIVFGGGFFATVLRFPLANVLGGFGLGFKVCFTHKAISPIEMTDKVCELAEIIRKDGPLGLEGVDIDHPLLAKGVQFIADGYDVEFMRGTLERERDLFLERLLEAKVVYKSLGDAGPAFGMIGTIVGLVQMLSGMDDPAAIGPAMAVALLTTLYGAMLATLIALPMADKLGNKIGIESINHDLIIDGIMELRANKAPALIREMLVTYTPAAKRPIEA